METHAPKAVFLSYAREDAASGRRIAEALRSSGIEVWFDENELRGGDAWDQKIRRQIKDCSLFLAIISAHTQERGEGYFRLEWNLADQRTLLMGRMKSFLLPICIDDITETDADVPDSFLAAQWTRLPNGEVATGFVQRVHELLNSPPAHHEADHRATPHSHPVTGEANGHAARAEAAERNALRGGIGGEAVAAAEQAEAGHGV